jgi:hypothetical protein
MKTRSISDSSRLKVETRKCVADSVFDPRMELAVFLTVLVPRMKTGYSVRLNENMKYF